MSRRGQVSAQLKTISQTEEATQRRPIRRGWLLANLITGQTDASRVVAQLGE